MGLKKEDAEQQPESWARPLCTQGFVEHRHSTAPDASKAHVAATLLPVGLMTLQKVMLDGQ